MKIRLCLLNQLLQNLAEVKHNNTYLQCVITSLKNLILLYCRDSWDL